MRLRLLGTAIAVLLPLLLMFGEAPLAAQTMPRQMLSAYIGQQVMQIDIAGRPDVTLNNVRSMIKVRENQPLRKEDIDATVAAFKSDSRFRDVQVDAEPQAQGIRVVFLLEPAIYIALYDFPGALKTFPYSRLLQVSNYSSPAPYSLSDVQQAANALEVFFRRSGYFLAKVKPEVVTDTPNQLATVEFHTDLGRRAKIGTIELQGATPDETAYLRKKLRSIMARLRGASLKPGVSYSNKRLDNAARYMESALNSQDYLSGTVKLISASYDPETNKADIVFNVSAGPKVKLSLHGAHIWSKTRKSLIPIYQEGSVDDELLEEGRRSLISYFQKKGYFDASVAVHTSRNPDQITVDYDIRKDGKHKVNELSFSGNKHFSDHDLVSYSAVRKGHFLSRGKYNEQLVRTSVKNIKGIYQAAGYSQAQVTPQVARKGGNVQITFQIVEGPLDVVHELRVEGNATVPQSQLVPGGLKLGPGKPYSPSLLTQDRNQILAHYLRSGYLNASFQAMAKPVPDQPHQFDIVYRITEGPQVRTAAILTVGRGHTRQSLISKQIEISPGQPLSENEMLSAETRLYNLNNIFDWAEVDPRKEIRDQRQEDVLVKVHEAKRNTVIYGFGFEVINRGGNVPSGTIAVPGVPPVGLPTNYRTNQQTFYGPRGSFEYTRRNIRGRAESYTVSAFAGRLDQRGTFTYTDPAFRNSTWTGSSIFSVEHDSENPIFTSRLGNFGLQFQKPFNAKKTSNLFLRYNFQLTKISRLLIPGLVPSNQLSVHLSTISASYIHDTRDNTLDAHRGIYESVEINLNPGWLGSNFSFARFLGQTLYFKNIGAGIIWANSVRLGYEQPFSGSVVPLSELFFSGGGSTLRGFPLNGAGPQRTICLDTACTSQTNVPTGGTKLFILNSELRYPLDFIKKGLGIVTFYDGGNVFARPSYANSTNTLYTNFGYSNSIGIGLRYSTPVGPVRIDVGRNLNPEPGINATQYFITLGQAF